jgi:hypothetical protein
VYYIDVWVCTGKKENYATSVNLNSGFGRVSVYIHDVVSTPRILKSGSFDCFQTGGNNFVLFSSCNDQYDTVLKQILTLLWYHGVYVTPVLFDSIFF